MRRRRVGDVAGHGEAGLQRPGRLVRLALRQLEADAQGEEIDDRAHLLHVRQEDVSTPALRTFSVRPQSHCSLRAPASTSWNVDSHGLRNVRDLLAREILQGRGHPLCRAPDTSRAPAGRPPSCS